ncbi:MAG: LamG-like jellyroll fold domain-containing protein [Chitinophagaceae bacterium]
MKKYLLALVVVVLQTGIAFSQNQGYSWTFGTLPPYTFNSVPAMPGSTTTHQLTLLGADILTGDTSIRSVSDSVGLGASCIGSFMNVGQYGAPPDYFVFGLQFENTPQFVDSVYTIEMTFKSSPTGNYHRVMGFTDLTTGDSTSDNGIYIRPDDPVSNGQLIFRVDSVEIGLGTTLDSSTWYHLTFVRDANHIITYYINGVWQGNYDDSLGNFLPLASNGNVISFFRDNGTEEVAGSIAKLSIYNRVLTESEIQKKTFKNICNTTVVLAADPNEGHQWKFPGSASSPFISTPAVAGSDSTYTLTAIGGGTITTDTAEIIGLGASCTAADSIAVYSLDLGLDFDNSPRYIYDTYTLELAINFTDLGTTSKRILSFYSLGTLPEATYGIYVNAAGNIDFFNGASNVVGASPLTINVWYHLVFVRAANDTISYYKDGVLIGTFVDSLNQFIPNNDNGNFITFFKDDDGTEETTGKITKIGIFNAVLPDYDVVERFNNICNDALVILPVNLTSFTATRAEDKVQLKWVTASEQNNLGFEVQRSSDGSNFTGIGFVNGNGTTNQENTYYFTDQSPQTGKNYYRLKQVDIDNRVTYSGIRSIEIGVANRGIQLFPNPSHSLITVTNIKAGNQMSIFNTQGNLVMRKRANNGQEIISIGTLPSGVYLLQVTDNENNKKTIRFTKF